MIRQCCKNLLIDQINNAAKIKSIDDLMKCMYLLCTKGFVCVLKADVSPTSMHVSPIAYNCYASANIKALETLGYAEHICNYVVILDSWFYGKVSVVGTPSNLGLISLDITGLLMLRIVSIYQ